MLQLFIRDAHQGLQSRLVAKPVTAREVQHLGTDESLDHAKHVCVSATLNLVQQQLLVRPKEDQLADIRKAVWQKLLTEIKTAAPDHVMVNVPADEFGDFDAFRVTQTVAGLGGGF